MEALFWIALILFFVSLIMFIVYLGLSSSDPEPDTKKNKIQKKITNYSLISVMIFGAIVCITDEITKEEHVYIQDKCK